MGIQTQYLVYTMPASTVYQSACIFYFSFRNNITLGVMSKTKFDYISFRPNMGHIKTEEQNYH